MWAVAGTVDEIDDSSDGRDSAIAGYADSCRILTGDSRGTVVVWRLVTRPAYNQGANTERESESPYALICLKIFSVQALLPAPTTPSVRSLCERDGVLLVGLQGCEVYEVIDNSVPFAEPTPLPDSSGAALPAPAPKETPAAAPVPPASDADTEAAESKGEAEADASEEAKVKAVFPPKMELNKDREAAGAKLGALEGAAASLASPVRFERLVASHNSGERWGLSSHPTAPFFFTSGDDRTLRCWSIEYSKMVSYLTLPEKSRALDLLMPGGEEMAIALNSGAVWVLKTAIFMPEKGAGLFMGDEILSPLPEGACRILKPAGARSIQEVKYSFDGSLGCRQSRQARVRVQCGQGLRASGR